MQVIISEIYDISLHHQMYAAINENNDAELHSIVKNAMSGLEHAHTT